MTSKKERRICVLTFSSAEEANKVPKISTCSEIAPVAGDRMMWSFLRKCLQTCMERHEECSARQKASWYPKRLLRLTRNEHKTDNLKLVQMENQSAKTPYIALSHCWGKGSPLCTTTKNLSRHLQDIALSDLPRTFQDCLTVAKEMDVSYIWIDSLCIIQDDRTDWAVHAQDMDLVFENALFTVAAVSSIDGSVPFLGPKAPSSRSNWQSIDMKWENIDGEPDGRKVAGIKARRFDLGLNPYACDGPLESRAWAWQERHLSVRTISFTEEEVRWKCDLVAVCECIGIADNTEHPEPAHGYLHRFTNDSEAQLLKRWYTIVNDYSKRHLTYYTDRLPALSGVASRIHGSLKSVYLAGLWQADLIRYLAWYRREVSDCATGKPKMWRSLDNGVPSWSWASVAEEVYGVWSYHLQYYPGDTSIEQDVNIASKADLVSTSCRPSTENVFGEVESGSYIELRGLVVDAEMESDIHGCGCVRRIGFSPQMIVPDCHIISDVSSGFFGTSNRKITPRRALPSDKLAKSFGKGRRTKGPVLCLLLFTSTQKGREHACVLILGKDQNKDDTYQRLGIGCGDTDWSGPLYKGREHWDTWKDWGSLGQWESWKEWFADAETRSIMII